MFGLGEGLESGLLIGVRISCWDFDVADET